MNSKASCNELATILSCQLYTLDNNLQQRHYDLEDVGDYLPGVMLINNMEQLCNTYMNKAGCDILHRSREELRAMGSAYFEEFFDPDEITLIARSSFELMLSGDTKQVRTFFQRVRPNENTDWQWFFLTCKLLPGADEAKSTDMILMAQAVNQMGNASRTLNNLLNENPLMYKEFKKLSLLTPREKEILRLIAAGHTSLQISEKLCISLLTVETHRKNIKQKLEVKTFTQLIRFATLFNL